MSLLWIKVASQEEPPYPEGISAHEKATQDKLWGSNDMNALFKGAPVTMTPWPAARLYGDYDKDLVHDSIRNMLKTKPEDRESLLTEVDPRSLHSNQPSLQRGAMEYYMNDEDRESGKSAYDRDQVGNRYPFVYRRDDGKNIILSGHHRAARALLRGEPLKALVVSGGSTRNPEPGKTE